LFDTLKIGSPKQIYRSGIEWNGLFPYYAGFPAEFAQNLIGGARLPSGARVLDPWNGSGTTTYAASRMGLQSVGIDLNPAMIIVARARSLPTSEADSLAPLASEILAKARKEAQRESATDDDPLLWWYSRPTATAIRTIERLVRRHLVGDLTLTPDGVKLENVSGIAASFYVSLFAICRRSVNQYKASNPTWLRRPKESEDKVSIDFELLTRDFLTNVEAMAAALARKQSLSLYENVSPELRLADTSATELESESVDFVLTSPPYCTRIDYTAATRVELALVSPLTGVDPDALSRKMTGSIRVPQHEISVSESWGPTCATFLETLRKHRSKASGGYYYKTHVDYFDKVARSITNVTRALKLGGGSVIVVQDSYYKEVHNDLPGIITEICKIRGLDLRLRKDFLISRSMSGINQKSKIYNRKSERVEAVLCFEKIANLTDCSDGEERRAN
jgi:DNA modification methylase